MAPGIAYKAALLTLMNAHTAKPHDGEALSSPSATIEEGQRYRSSVALGWRPVDLASIS
jgi:hypothetical protein